MQPARAGELRTTRAPVPGGLDGRVDGSAVVEDDVASVHLGGVDLLRGSWHLKVNWQDVSWDLDGRAGASCIHKGEMRTALKGE